MHSKLAFRNRSIGRCSSGSLAFSIAEGREVAGAVSITEAETVWRFVPRDPWRDGTYRLVVGSELEDVAGNSVAAPFEVDLTTPITKRVASDRVEVPFVAKGARRAR